MPDYRSKTSTHGRNMAGARALWRATGMKDDDFKKPIIAIANSFTQFVPGHVHLKDLGQLVAREIERAGPAQRPAPRRDLGELLKERDAQRDQRNARLHHSPFHWGGRFSMNAQMPSAASADFERTVCASASMSSSSDSVCSAP